MVQDMIKEDYVSFETAKLLKEKGFEEVCSAYYEDFEKKQYLHMCYKRGNYNIVFKHREDLENRFNLPRERYKCAAPTLQMAMKWLRKVHKIFIEPKMSKNTFLWGYRVSISNGSTVCLHANTFNECEDSCSAAIKYCLENLI